MLNRIRIIIANVIRQPTDEMRQSECKIKLCPDESGDKQELNKK